MLFPLPFALSAQPAGEILQRVSAATDNKQQGQIISLFRQTVNTNIEKAEMFHWTGVDKNIGIASKFASESASFYKKSRSCNKAYLFYRELLQKSSNDTSCLASCDEMEVRRGKKAEALKTYEKILTLDADNPAANIFVGNYYYPKTEQEKQKIENDCEKINAPIWMRYVRYRGGPSQTLAAGYVEAEGYLERVVSQFPSAEVEGILDRIKLIEKEMNRW